MSQKQTPTDSPLLLALGRNLLELREKQGIKQNAMANALDGIKGADKSALSRLERGLSGWPEHIDMIVAGYAEQCDRQPITIWTNALRDAGYLRHGAESMRTTLERAREEADAAKPASRKSR